MPFSVGSYRKINNSWYMPTEVEVSNAWSTIFVGGQVRALDEKMKRWRGKSPCIRNVQSKPEPIGHRMSHFWPFNLHRNVSFCSCCTTLGEKQKVCNVVNWTANLHNASFPHSVLVADSYYLDLHSMNQRYLCSIKSDRFKNLQDSLAEPEADSNVDVRPVMSNAFKVTKQPSNMPPAWKEYKYSFDVCDEFNWNEGRTYALRRCKWEYNFDDMFPTSLLINTAKVWKTRDIDARRGLTYSYYFNELAKELILV